MIDGRRGIGGSAFRHVEPTFKHLTPEGASEKGFSSQSETFQTIQELLQKYDLDQAVIFSIGMMQGDDRTGPEIIKALGNKSDLFRLGHILRTKEKLMEDERDAHALVHDIIKDDPEVRDLVVKLIKQYEINDKNKGLLLASAAASGLITGAQ